MTRAIHKKLSRASGSVAQHTLFEEEPPPPEMAREALDQWYTRPVLAKRVAEWARPRGRVLEPSAGSGNLVEAALGVNAVESVIAVEFDPLRAEQLRRRFVGFPDVEVRQADFLSVVRDAPPGVLFDLGLMNPPYSGDRDLTHVTAAASICARVVAIVRSAFLHADVRRPFWRSHELMRLVYLMTRPDFESEVGGNGAMSDFVVIEVRQAPGRGDGPHNPFVEFW